MWFVEVYTCTLVDVMTHSFLRHLVGSCILISIHSPAGGMTITIVFVVVPIGQFICLLCQICDLSSGMFVTILTAANIHMMLWCDVYLI